MWRVVCGLCCAIIVLRGVAEPTPVMSQESVATVLASTSENSSPEERIEAALNSRLKSPLDFQELPLNGVLDMLSDEYDISIQIDLAALDEIALSPETEVTIQVRNISLRSALNLMLRQPGLEDLSYVIDDEVLLITTEEAANAKLETVVYRVSDLEYYPPLLQAAGGWSPYSSLITVVTSCVEPNSWTESGKGQGEICLLKPGVLVVSQVPRVHGEIRQLFAELREAQKINSTVAVESNEPSPVRTRGFVLSTDIAEATQEHRETIAKAIMDSVDWGDRDNDEVWILFVGKRILVRHREDVLDRVQRAIAEMQLASLAKGVNVGGFGFGFGGGSGSGGGGGGGGAF